MDSSTSAFSTIGTHHHHWQSLALFALPFLLYSTSLEFDLLGYDDSRYYLVNRALHGQGGLIAIFTSTFYSDYMPLTQLTWWIDLALFGDESWWGARLHQLVWFGAGSLSVRAIIARVTGRSDLAFAVALLFALHPVTTHSILWLAQRKSLVSFALAFWAVERYVSARTATRTRTAWKRGAVAIVLTVLATFSKAHAVAIPMLILSYELCLGQGSARRRALSVVPFVLIAGLFVTVNLLGLRADLASTVPGVSRLGVLPMDGSILLRYLLNAFLPFGVDPLPSLSFFYAVDA